MIKIIYLTDNQMRELTTYLGECHTGCWMGHGERHHTPEDEIPQWRRLLDLLNAHVTWYMQPTNPFSHGQPIPDPSKHPEGMYYNDPDLSVEADVTALLTQVAWKLLFLDPGLKVNTRTEDLVTRQHFVPAYDRELPY